MTLRDAVDHLRPLAQRSAGLGVHLCNAWTLALAGRDGLFAGELAGDLNLADGAPVAWVGRFLGHPNMTKPVRGPSLMLDVMRDGLSWGARHYLYGGTPETVGALRERLPALVPGLDVVGLESRPFRVLTPLEEDEVVARITASRPHFVWVGLGTPQQNHFIHAFAGRLGAVTVGVGAAFDFAAGTVREAPRWMQGNGLEWLHRLATEPRRLWRRYLVGNVQFLAGVVRHHGRYVTPVPPVVVAEQAASADARPVAAEDPASTST